MFLSVLGLLTFAIENAIDLKLKTPFTIFLSFMLMQSVIASLIPTSNSRPLIADYVLASLFLSAGSTLGAAVVYYLAQLEGDPPPLAHRFITQWLAFPFYPSHWKALLFCKRKSFTRVISVSSSSTPRPPSRSRHQEPRKRDAEGGEWAEIAATLNRMFAMAYVIVSVILFVFYLLPIFLAY